MSEEENIKNVTPEKKQTIELAPEKKPVKKKAIAKKVPRKKPIKKQTTVIAKKALPMKLSPETLISQGIEKGISIEVMEKLLAMRRELKAEAAREDYYKALALFQQSCPIIKKTNPVFNKDGSIRYWFAPLDKIIEGCKNQLKEYGFSYNFITEQNEKSVKAICVSHHLSGHSEKTAVEIPIESSAFMNNAQEVATALTYATRYSFRNGFGILTGDDDDDARSMGNGESNEKTNGKYKEPQRKSKANKTSEPPQDNQNKCPKLRDLISKMLAGSTIPVGQQRVLNDKAEELLKTRNEIALEALKVSINRQTKTLEEGESK